MADGEPPRGDSAVADGKATPAIARNPRVATQPGVGPAAGAAGSSDGSDPGVDDTLGAPPPPASALGLDDTIGAEPTTPAARHAAKRVRTEPGVAGTKAASLDKLGTDDTIGAASVEKLGVAETIGVQPAGAADTLAAAAPPATKPKRAGGVDETLPGPGAPPALGATVGEESSAGRPFGDADTIGADGPPHGGTLQGPFKVADLPTLPRVDDNTYAIGTEIARGGMGKILSARDRRLRREVVIKVMRRDAGRIDPRFEREALITARLQHPSIVRVYDAGVLGDGRAFYAMERVRGRSLEVILEEAKTLAARLALLPHAIAVCDALAYAHNEGIVHRDLKPANVLIGPYGETVVIDWGLAKDLNAAEIDIEKSANMSAEELARATEDSSLTQHGAVMGTPAYMAPEQARGEVADERTDVYALGVLLFTMLSGAPPVSGTSAGEIIDAVGTGKRKKLDEVVPELPPELVTIVERAMRHERDERYPNAKQLADDLRTFAAGKLVPGHEYTTWELVKRWLWRHRVPVGLAVTFIVLMIVGAALAFHEIVDERDRANLSASNERIAAANLRTAVDRFCLEEAVKAAPNDPSLAAAWLKGLTDDGLSWPETADLANSLPERGLSYLYRDHTKDVEIVLPGRDGIHVVTASDDGTARWWNLQTRTSVVLAGHVGDIDSMTLSPDGAHLATGGTDHKVILWTLATGAHRVLVGPDGNGHGNTVRGVAFSPDNKHLASAGEDGTLYVWDVETGTGHRLLKYDYSLRPLAWLDNKTVLAGGFNGSVGTVDITTGKAGWKRPLQAELRTIAVTPDKKYIVIGDEDGRTAICTPQGDVVRQLTPHRNVTRKALITPDGKYVISAGDNEDVHVHTIPGGELIALKGNEGGVKDIDLSPDGLVASAGLDKTIRIWRLDGTLLHSWHGHTSAVKGVAFAGANVVSGAEDDVVRVWSLTDPPKPPAGHALRTWLDQHTNEHVDTPGAKKHP